MKEWFSYRNGFVNVDEEWIYFTPSGNWSETLNLPERTRKSPNRKRKLSQSLMGFLVLSSAIGITVSVASIRDSSLKYPTMIVGIVLALWLFTKRENQPHFKISRQLINSFSFGNSGVTISFSNHLGEKHQIVLNGIADKGMAIFQNIHKQRTHPNTSKNGQ